MSKFNYKKVIPRYKAFVWVMVLLCISVLVKAMYIMTAQRGYWMQVADRVKRDSVPVKPTRGNILSSDGRLMASSLPEYKIFMDFKAVKEAKNDSLWHVKLDSISKGLNQIFPSKSAQEFKAYLQEGYKKESRHWPIWPSRVNYNVFTDVKALPIFRLAQYKGGFHFEEFNARQRPYGSLAGRTIGEMYGAKDTARFGLELSYDSILRGTDGINHRRKVLNKFLDIPVKAPVDGLDIVTTIDVGMQDLAERSVINELKEINGNVGVAIVMEVKTGDIKAIVNMERCGDGEYRERKNHAVSDLLEPGSVFKVASMLVALDDGYVDTSYVVETGGGVWPMYGREMKDHNWRRGGYGTINFTKSLMVSSNIGVSRIVDKFYHDDPTRFVKGIYRTGLADDLHIPLLGASPARIRMPKKAANGQWLNWSNTALPWMSIGYETQIPPISTLTFYNAIANGGKMMQPRFVKQVVKNGEVIQEFPPKVLREQIAKPQSISKMRDVLEYVVTYGLGRKAGSKSFKVAGKTGTAQMSKGVAGYKSGMVDYLLSFAGFFPADNPRYSCIVCIQKSGLPASGGGMCGPVFHHISEGIMAQDIKLDIKDARDSSSVLIPEVKIGNVLSSTYVLDKLGIKTQSPWSSVPINSKPVWGKAQKAGQTALRLERIKQFGSAFVPDVIGMGARDAVYLLESRGVKTRIIGRGKVVKQSLSAGHRIVKGSICELILE